MTTTIADRATGGYALEADEGEAFWLTGMLEGNLTVYVGDTKADLTTGGFAFGPEGVPHTFIGAGPGPTRVLVGLAPLQFILGPPGPPPGR